MKNRIIAFYLPQYHPTLDNDLWWGKGFTEWTNVGKAKPLFRKHYQPKIPADLGYYDLRLPEARKAQAQMAKEAGIEGFCYYHYWFGNGKQELEFPFNEVLRLKEPDFPFCLCWANESWHAKFWNIDGTIKSKRTLIEQKYDDEKGNEEHFYHLLPAFKDNRYIQINNKPIFYIYQPLNFPKIKEFIMQWNDLAIRNGLDGIYFIGQTPSPSEISNILGLGFDAINIIRLFYFKNFIANNVFVRLYRKLFNKPLIVQYKSILNSFIGEESLKENVYPTVIPNWDHTPRSGRGGCVFENSTPKLFKRHLENTLELIKNKPAEHRIVFLKSWNEWGEGNYVEPDLKYGRQYLDCIHDLINIDIDENSNNRIQ